MYVRMTRIEIDIFLGFISMLWIFMTVVMTVIVILVAKEAFDKQKKRNEEFEATLKTKSLTKDTPKWRPYNSSESFSTIAYKETDSSKSDYVVSDKYYMSRVNTKKTLPPVYQQSCGEEYYPEYVLNTPASPSYNPSLPEGIFVPNWTKSPF